MTQEEKSLLFQDLSARLPYGVKVKCEKYQFPVTVLYVGNVDEVKFAETGGIEHICLIKPYLRPMSSMTEEEKIEYQLFCDYYMDDKEEKHYFNNIATLDWYHQKHFDCRGLIKLGLALEAPNGMYK